MIDTIVTVYVYCCTWRLEPEWALATDTWGSLNPSYDCPHKLAAYLHAHAHANVRARAIKKRLDAIAGNIKLVMWAGPWIKTVWTKKIEKQVWNHVKDSAASHYWEGMTCFALHWIWWLYPEWFLIFRISLPIQLSFGHHNLFHQVRKNFSFFSIVVWFLSSLLNSTPLWCDFFLSLIRFSIDYSCSCIFHNSPEFKNLLVGGPAIETNPVGRQTEVNT